MRPLTNNDIESELSYAYLHAVAARAGASCESTGRAADGNGIDAIVTGWGPFPNGGYLQEVDLKIQLKATTEIPVVQNGYLSYRLNGIGRYNDLRGEALATHRLLVVLFLPKNPEEWLRVSPEELILKKSAYWASLRGAPPSANETAQTVYLPESQLFTPENLQTLFARLSRQEVLAYSRP
jgi:hypothetical protein